MLIANIVMKDPSVIDRDDSGTQINPDLGIEVALSHLNLARTATYGKVIIIILIFIIIIILFNSFFKLLVEKIC